MIRLGVIVWSLILVVNHQSDGCAEGHTVFGARLNVYRVEFGPLNRDTGQPRLSLSFVSNRVPIGDKGEGSGPYSSGEITLARTSTTQLHLNILLGQVQSLQK